MFFFTPAEKQGRVICDFRSKSGTHSFGDKLNTELIRSRPGAREKNRPLDVVAKSHNTCHLSAHALRMTIIKGVVCGDAQNGGRGSVSGRCDVSCILIGSVCLRGAMPVRQQLQPESRKTVDKELETHVSVALTVFPVATLGTAATHNKTTPTLRKASLCIRPQEELEKKNHLINFNLWTSEFFLSIAS